MHNHTHALIIAVVGLLLMVLAYLAGYLILHTEHIYVPRAKCLGWWVLRVWRARGGGNPCLFIRIFGHTFAIYKYPLV